MRAMLGSRHLRLASLALVTLVAHPARADFEAEDIEIRISLGEQQPEMEKLLIEWVDLNTGTWNTAGLESFVPLVGAKLAELGFEVKIEPGVEFEYPDRDAARSGPLLVAERKAQVNPEQARHFLLLGHVDTVFEPDSKFQKYAPDPANPRHAFGPGVMDMKGGIVAMLYALRALAESGDLARADYTVLINSDEELGSLASRPRIEAEARRAQLGFVFEPARESGEMARSRSGVGQFHLAVEGVASHVATSQRDGRSAIVAIAKKVIAIESLTDYERGIILNVGTISGGTKRNIVPAHAEAWIDLRFDEPAQGLEVQRELGRIAQANDGAGTSGKLWGLLHRPPKVETPEVTELLAAHRKVVSRLGYGVPEAVHSAGVTDGSIMAEAGLPTLDSMGVRGGGAHTDQEFIVLSSLAERATIAAILLRQLSREAPEPSDATETPAPPAEETAPAEPEAAPAPAKPRSGLPPGGVKLESPRPSPPVIAGSRPVVGP